MNRIASKNICISNTTLRLRIDTYLFDYDSVNEAIVNAIAHRDYSIERAQIDIDIFKNRLEITSPEAWILSKESNEYEITNIPSIRRNKVICNCFECIGLMEKIDSGFKTIYKDYENFKIKSFYLKIIKTSLLLLYMTYYMMMVKIMYYLENMMRQYWNFAKIKLVQEKKFKII